MLLLLDYYVWEWEDEKKRWNPYLAQTAVDLEKAKTFKEAHHSFSAFGRDYTVHMEELQQMNDDTEVERPVRREKSGNGVTGVSIGIYLP